MKPINFFVPGQPQGKARARTVTHNGYTHSYTPRKTVEYEQTIGAMYRLAGGRQFPDNTPLSVHITAMFAVPKSYPKWKRDKCFSGEFRPMVKPDCDNITKAVLDALNGIAYHDDKQVVAIDCIKGYATSDGAEGVWVYISHI